MSFAVKLDENLSLAHVHLLRQAGYDADRVDDQGLSGATDERVWERVCADNRLFVTLDLDFSDIRRYQPGTHPGILLIRTRSRSTKAVMEILTRVTAERPLDELRDAWRLPIGTSPEFAVHLSRSAAQSGIPGAIVA